MSTESFMNNFNFSVDETEGPSDAEQQMSSQLQARNAQDTIELSASACAAR
jgi:hypothetical protein